MQGKNRTFGLIGFPLGHSYSKVHFSSKFQKENLVNYRYLNFEIPSVTLIEKIIGETEDLAGLNVTIPYKQAVMSYLDQIDQVAMTIGAVNTIKIIHEGGHCQLRGYNTDVTGFTKSLACWPLDSSVKALVFGSGGSSLAVKYALKMLGIGLTSVSRKKEEGFISYEDLTIKIASEHRLWINCTPVGMFPETSARLPLPYQCLTPGHYLFDLIYNPETTMFLKMGIEAGSSVMNGRKMLYEQAEASWEIWNNEAC